MHDGTDEDYLIKYYGFTELCTPRLSRRTHGSFVDLNNEISQEALKLYQQVGTGYDRLTGVMQ